MKKRQRTTTTKTTAMDSCGISRSESTLHSSKGSLLLSSLVPARANCISSSRHLLLVLLSLLLSSAETRLVGKGHQQYINEASNNQIEGPNGKREVREEFAAKYPAISAEIIRRRRQEQRERLHVGQDNESEGRYYLDTQDSDGIVDLSQSRDLQQQLTVTSVNDNDSTNKPLITLTLSKQPSSLSQAVDTILQNQVSNLKATKGLNQRGAQTLDVEFLLDRTEAERQTKTRFQVQINLVALAMGRTDGLSITAQEEGGEVVNGSVTGVDKLIVSEYPGADGGADGGAHHKHDGLHLVAVAPPSKPPAPLTRPLVDETMLPP